MTHNKVRQGRYGAAVGPRGRASRSRLAVTRMEDRAMPSTYWVNTTADTFDSNPNVTSLRDAIQAATASVGSPT